MILRFQGQNLLNNQEYFEAAIRHDSLFQQCGELFMLRSFNIFKRVNRVTNVLCLYFSLVNTYLDQP